jgi:PIN domain nuclease of toxin-antitoxin system
MSHLVDTHVLLWWLTDDPRLGAATRGILRDPTKKIYVSSASAWEIATKFRIGKLPIAAPLVADFGGFVARCGFTELPISLEHGLLAGSWANEHRDPFDRMLAAQSRVEDLVLISDDSAFVSFGIRLAT